MTRTTLPEPGILIVDAQEASCTAVAVALRPVGRELFAATSGEEALECLADRRIGLVIIDPDLPGIDGLSVIEKIERERPDVRVIVLAANHEAELIEECRRHGVVDVVWKSMGARELLSRVRRALTPGDIERPR